MPFHFLVFEEELVATCTTRDDVLADGDMCHREAVLYWCASSGCRIYLAIAAQPAEHAEHASPLPLLVTGRRSVPVPSITATVVEVPATVGVAVVVTSVSG